MGNLTNIFSPFLWKKEITETSDILKLVQPQIESNIKKYPTLTPENWDCVTHSSAFNVHVGNEINNKFCTDAVLEVYRKYVKSFCKDFNIDDKRFHVNDFWYNAFLNNHFQEPHTHLPGVFSAVHYLIFDSTVHSATTFINPNISTTQSINAFKPNLMQVLAKDNLQHSCFLNNFTPKDIAAGDIIIFPSFLNHYVRPNNSNKKRVTISFDILLDGTF